MKMGVPTMDSSSEMTSPRLRTWVVSFSPPWARRDPIRPAPMIVQTSEEDATVLELSDIPLDSAHADREAIFSAFREAMERV